MDEILPLNFTELNRVIQCYAETIYRFNGVWEGPDPLTPVVPLFLVQITLAISAARLCVFALKPFNQPPFIAEILVSFFFSSLIFPFLINYYVLAIPSVSYNLYVYIYVS